VNKLFSALIGLLAAALLLFETITKQHLAYSGYLTAIGLLLFVIVFELRRKDD